MDEVEYYAFLGPLETWQSNILGKFRALKIGSHWTARSIVYYCPECGIPWGGRIEVLPRDRQVTHNFWYLHRECQAHEGGTLFDKYDIVETFPEALIRYELRLMQLTWSKP